MDSVPVFALARACRARYWTFVPVWYSNCKSDSRQRAPSPGRGRWRRNNGRLV